MALTITSDDFIDPHFRPSVVVERRDPPKVAAPTMMVTLRYHISEAETKHSVMEGDTEVGCIWVGSVSGRIWGITIRIPDAPVVMFDRLRSALALITETEQQGPNRKSVLKHYETVEASMDFDGFGPQSHWLHPMMFPVVSP